ncbi:MAG: hypothetical protein HN411_03460 [Waddliaceae bacterium]|jgi:hypothetical protein|nr:hypothetical protein [Waddliaceae bacterium]MBT3578971.1 hypothetical protein [Waddliaceae bacterium]MBT4445096.1 hypothetical protein [Waddliaceae bacterium]MBT6928961.1 hypothetical protein [Waddliaceae bacterium]MBT7264543.1 hypothetical protein [Waddliaceae bacterium]
MSIDPGNAVPDPSTVAPLGGVSDPVVDENVAAALNAEKVASYTNASTVSSLEDLKKKAKKVYDQMMKGIAQTIITQMRRSQERIKKINRSGR